MKIHFLAHRENHLNKKNQFPSLFSFGKNPYHDWKILFLFFTILFVSGLLCSIYFFFRVAKGDLFQSPVNQTVKLKTFDRVFMKEVLTDFDTKRENFEELKKRRIDIINP